MSWANLKSQKHAVEILRRSLQRGRLAHAYLFVAENITEAESLARELAKAVNCEKGDPDACDHCTGCRKIQTNNHPDVRWVRAEMKSRQIGIEAIRELEQPLYLAAGEGHTKVAILVEADRLTTDAANAFLKTLEEPPADSLVLLLTTEPQRLLETILSRCLRIGLAAGERPELTERQQQALTQFAELLESKNEIAPTYRFLAWLTAQLAELKEEAKAKVEADAQLERYQESNPDWVKHQDEALEAATVAEYVRERTRWLALFSRWLRDVMLCAEGAPESLLTFPTEAARLKTLSTCGSPASARARVEVFEDLQKTLGRNVNEILALEVALLKLGSRT